MVNSKTLLILGAIILLLAGCAFPATMKRHDTQQVLRCDSSNDLTWALDNYNCIKALERQGFVRVE